MALESIKQAGGSHGGSMRDLMGSTQRLLEARDWHTTGCRAHEGVREAKRNGEGREGCSSKVSFDVSCDARRAGQRQGQGNVVGPMVIRMDTWQ